MLDAHGNCFFNDIEAFLPHGVVYDIRNSGIFTSHQEDRVIWKNNSSGSFCLGWESIRNRTGVQAWTQFVWDKAIPTIISIFAWKLLFDFVCGDFRIS